MYLSVPDVLLLFRRYAGVLLGIPFLLAAAAAAISMTSARTYTGFASFVPQAASGGGGAVGLAAQLGVNLGGGNAGHSPEFYARLVRSREILARVAEQPIPGPDGSNLPAGALAAAYGVEEPDPEERRRQLLEVLQASVTSEAEPLTGLVEVELVAPTEPLAELLALRIVDAVNAFNQEQRKSQASAEREFAGARLQEAQAELAGTESRLEAFLRSNPQYSNAPELTLQFERLQRQLGLQQQVVVTLTQLYEQARIEQIRNTPVITVIENPIGSAKPNSRGTVLNALVTGVVGCLIAGAMVAFWETRRWLAAQRAGGERGRTGDAPPRHGRPRPETVAEVDAR